MSFLSKKFKYQNALGEEIVFDYAHGYLINFPDGVDSVGVKVSTSAGTNNIGSSVQSTAISERAVTINGIVVGANGQELKDRLISVIRPDMTGRLYADGQYLECYVSASPVIGPEPFGARFQVGLLAPYPYWVNGAGKVVYMSGIEARFKFPWNMSRTYQFGEKIAAQYKNVLNLGQVDSPFVITIRCAGESAKNPRITNLLTGEYLLVNKTLENMEILTISTTHTHTVIESTKDGNCDGALDIESDLYRLHTGDNILRPSADSGLDNLTIQISHADEYIGVAVV